MKRVALLLLLLCASPLLPRASADHACVFVLDPLDDADLSHIEPDLFEAITTLAPSATPILDANVTDDKSVRAAAIFTSNEDAEVFCEDVETSLQLFFSHASSNVSFAVRDAKVAEIPESSMNMTSSPVVDGANAGPLSFTCCGFLCTGTCSWYAVTGRCRCSRGCSGTVQFALPQDVDPGFCRETNAYNNGQWCTRYFKMRFNGSFNISAKRGYMTYIRSGKGVWRGSSASTVTITC